jgi:hypothetical protein
MFASFTSDCLAVFFFLGGITQQEIFGPWTSKPQLPVLIGAMVIGVQLCVAFTISNMGTDGGEAARVYVERYGVSSTLARRVMLILLVIAVYWGLASFGMWVYYK